MPSKNCCLYKEMRKVKREDSSEDTDEGSEEGGEEIDNTYLATADPLDELDFSPELIDIATEATEQYEILKEEKSKDLVYGDINIYPVQYVAATVFMSTDGITQFRAPTGFGKTLTALAAAMMSERCLIIVPSKTLGSTWITHCTKFGLYSSTPEKTDVFIHDTSKVQTHRRYLENPNNVNALKKRGNLVVICNHPNIERAMQYVFTKEIIAGKEFTVIVDEAHKKIVKLLKIIQPMVENKSVKRELLMSGSEIDPKRNGFAQIKATINHTIIAKSTNTLPTDIWHVIYMESESHVKNLNEWKDEVKKILKKNKLTVIAAKDDALSALYDAGTFTKKKIFDYRGQARILGNFAKADDAVLLMLKTGSEGLNINADSMIIINPGDTNTDRLIQLTKRIIRPDNPHDVVNIYLLCGTLEEYLRVLYAKAFSLLEWPIKWGRQADVNAGMVYKGLASIRALGHNHETVNRIDLCVFLADYQDLTKQKKMTDPYNEIIEWWNEYKEADTILTEDIIRDIIII
jgi:superfamily II DNA or RNA helicase